MPDSEPQIETWVERFQCEKYQRTNVDPIVAVYFKKNIGEHELNVHERHELKLSQLPYLQELMIPERVLELEKGARGIPASDRIVSRSDNEKAYDETLEAVEKAEAALRESNLEIEGKDDIVAELSAFQKLMKRGRVAVGVIGTLAIRGLAKVRDKIVDTALKIPIEYALTKLGQLVGWAYKLFAS